MTLKVFEIIPVIVTMSEDLPYLNNNVKSIKIAQSIDVLLDPVTVAISHTI